MTETSPRVSVIIPVYNSMPYLSGAVQSLLDQTLGNIEVIAIDDGSNDGSGEELDRFASLDARVTVLHQENSGWPGMPRNRGLERARGEFVFFMDGDDEMAAHGLEQMVAAAEANEADIVIPRFVGTGGRGVASLFLLYPEGEISVSRAMETLSPQKLFRRSLIEGLGVRFPEGKVRLEDGIFVTECYLAARRIEFCGSDPLYFIAKRDDSQNISSRRIDPDGYVASCRAIATLLVAGGGTSEEAAKLVREFFLRKGLRFYAHHRWMSMDEQRRQRWVSLHQAFLRDYLPEASDAGVAFPSDRRKMGLIRAGDVAGLTRLIAAGPKLGHTPVCAGVTERPFGLEIRVWLRPTPDAELLRQAADPRPGSLRLANAWYRLTAAAMQVRQVRAVSRRISGALASSATGATLLLAGRKAGAPIEIAGVLCGWQADTEARLFRFLVPHALLKRYRRDRVDLWTVANQGELSGARVRVRAPERYRKKLSQGSAYATKQGNLSLHLR